MKRVRRVGLVLILAFAAVAADAQDKFAKVTFVVVRETNGKPIRNASVVFHQLDENGKPEKDGSFQLKTNDEGITVYPTVQFGKIRLQVIAQGYRTFGEDYVIDKAEQEFTVKMQRPTEQYSIYGDNKKKQ